MQEHETNWIWHPDWGAADKESPALVLFRRELEFLEPPEQAVIEISADSRYKLYLNGEMVEMGPDRGDRQIWFYDEVDLKPHLAHGKNVIAVQVLRYPLEYFKGNYGIFRTEFPGLYVRGALTYPSGKTVPLNADRTWKCHKEPGFHIVPESEGFAPLHIYEDRWGDAFLQGWMQPGYDDSGWQKARPYPDISQSTSPGNLHPRTIPFLYRKRRSFQGVTALRESAAGETAWNALLHQAAPLQIPAHSREVVEITAGEEMTAYLRLAVLGGRGAKIALLQSESYVQKGFHNEYPLKGNRNDWETGFLSGFTDHYHVGGFGTREHPEEYEPFWFRTFRFIRLEIETADEPISLNRLDFTETGYPLDVRTQVQVSDPSLAKVWEISERTLRRCMHETYEDCPFYEQQQYAMDSRSEILYTYSVSADDRLARKCLDDFKRSQRYDGLLNCSYPCCRPNVIPGFSIYYILMLYDHMMYFGDRALLEDHLPVAERILNFFQRRLTPEGCVAKLGGLNGKAAKWSFIDWTPEWDATTGVPPAVLQGPITMESLLYIMGLQHAAGIADWLGRVELSEQYRNRAKSVQDAVRNCCTGKNGMIQDGPGVDQYSQHVQVFALLTDTVEPAQGKINLEEALLYPDKYAQCSVAMAFYLYRALQKMDSYVWTQEYWPIWTRMVEKGATTCIEDEVGERSDCHAWGALALYELPSIILGVQPAKPGYEAIRIAPEPGYLEYAEGSVITPKGMVSVRWDLRNGGRLEYEAPDGVEIQADTAALKKAAGYR